jgi:hypothetical protein
MMLVDFEENVSSAQGAIYVELTIGSKTLSTTFFVIGYLPIVAYHLQCINASSNGSKIQWRWCKEKPP